MSTDLVITTTSKVRSSLQPLVYGQPVSLLVSDPKVRIKKRIGKPILFITPSEFYGLDGGSLIFALQGHGCEAMHKNKLKRSYLVRLGLSFRAARLLVSELSRLFNTEE